MKLILLFSTQFTDEKFHSENIIINWSLEECPFLGGGLPYLSDKSAGNLRVSSFWRDQVEREKERYKHLNAEI